LLLCLSFAALACSSSPGSSSPQDAGGDSSLHDGAADGVADTSSPPPERDGASDAGVDAAFHDTCTPLGGLCIPIAPGSSCPAGYHAANGAAACLVGAQCCLHGGDGGVNGCTSAGGVCVTSAAACGPSVGHLGSPFESAFCTGPSAVCCFEPATSCGGLEMFGCSDGMTCSRPVCQAGTLVCGMGTTQTPRGTPPC
jgi:hypothetical protein